MLTPLPFQDALLRLRAGLVTAPRGADWARFGIALAGCAAAAGVFGAASGLLIWSPAFDATLLRLALIAIVLPALGEEVVFRGLLIDPSRSVWWTIPALAAFVVWHPVNAFLFFPQALALFADLRFLAIVSCLGAASTWLWWTSGSLWPSILLHWILVVAWKALFESPRLL